MNFDSFLTFQSCERVSDCCLAPCEQCTIYIYIISRISYISMIRSWCSLYTRPTRLSGSFSASSLKEQSTGGHVPPFGHIIPIPTVWYVFLFYQPTSLYFYSVVCIVCLAEKQHISILWSLIWPDWDLNPQSTVALQS